jgi:DNA-binding LacI/PurR family transcriptional regulator
MKYSVIQIAKESGVTRRIVYDVLGPKKIPVSHQTLSKIANAITKLYYPVTADDLRVGVGVSSNPFLRGIRQQRRDRRCAEELSGLINNLYDLLSHDT